MTPVTWDLTHPAVGRLLLTERRTYRQLPMRIDVDRQTVGLVIGIIYPKDAKAMLWVIDPDGGVFINRRTENVVLMDKQRLDVLVSCGETGFLGGSRWILI